MGSSSGGEGRGDAPLCMWCGEPLSADPTWIGHWDGQAFYHAGFEVLEGYTHRGACTWRFLEKRTGMKIAFDADGNFDSKAQEAIDEQQQQEGERHGG